jgi:hypothetical protein
MDMWRNHLNPFCVSEELRGYEILHRFYPETIELIHMQTRQNMKKLYLVKVVVITQSRPISTESIEMIAPVIIELLAKYIKNELLTCK